MIARWCDTQKTGWGKKTNVGAQRAWGNLSVSKIIQDFKTILPLKDGKKICQFLCRLQTHGMINWGIIYSFIKLG